MEKRSAKTHETPALCKVQQLVEFQIRDEVFLFSKTQLDEEVCDIGSLAHITPPAFSLSDNKPTMPTVCDATSEGKHMQPS